MLSSCGVGRNDQPTQACFGAKGGIIMILAASTINFIPTTGIWNAIFNETWLDVNLFGWFGADGVKITLAGLIVILLVGLAAAAIVERLAGEKPGKNLLAVAILTLLGAYIFAGAVKLPFEVILQGVPIIAALLGAIIFGVFFVLIRKQVSPSRSASAH
jgi:drug/metabolite transporter (DMT)-like permease